jgi:hypothetical protein
MLCLGVKVYIKITINVHIAIFLIGKRNRIILFFSTLHKKDVISCARKTLCPRFQPPIRLYLLTHRLHHHLLLQPNLSYLPHPLAIPKLLCYSFPLVSTIPSTIHGHIDLHSPHHTSHYDVIVLGDRSFVYRVLFGRESA